ncbi:MAG: ATP-binding protein [Sedimentisphaerales bacterium]|nr:ATP-binding protein [Sedimentisphaerales bacterium]
MGTDQANNSRRQTSSSQTSQVPSGTASRSTIQQLEELAKLTGELAHEIKTPLSTLKINVRLVREDLDRPELTSIPDVARAVRKLAVIQEEADRLEAILTGFLRYIGKTEIKPSPQDLNLIVQDMIDFYLPQAHTSNITLRHLLTKESLVCNVDAGMLKQVLLNIFVNAQQAMPNGGELMVRTESRPPSAIIQISDTGCGIAPDCIGKIFEPYYSSKPKGTGLGLPTAKKIVEAHGGKILVSSELGKGTSVSIILPLYRTSGQPCQ